jgi:tRNA (cytidine/uridine-2'-O-)-methyltransferase
MFEVVLYQPEIPPNTGNVIRLCANAGARLHLIYPLGFEWDSARVRRAGLDYHELTNIQHHDNWAACASALAGRRIFAVDNPGCTRYDQVAFQAGDVFVFGQETRGLPNSVIGTIAEDRRLELPMQPDNRSLNLSNSVAIVVYEAWRQCAFAGAALRAPTS